jgi:predicted DNA-binding transcriptional regulator AlpA
MTQQAALTETQVAERLGLSVATLRAWRFRKIGPPFVRFGRAVRYIAQDIDGYVEASRIDTEAASSSDGPHFERK